jgi:hypothetical protein
MRNVRASAKYGHDPKFDTENRPHALGGYIHSADLPPNVAQDKPGGQRRARNSQLARALNPPTRRHYVTVT